MVSCRDTLSADFGYGIKLSKCDHRRISANYPLPERFDFL